MSPFSPTTSLTEERSYLREFLGRVRFISVKLLEPSSEPVRWRSFRTSRESPSCRKSREGRRESDPSRIHEQPRRGGGGGQCSPRVRTKLSSSAKEGNARERPKLK